MRIIEKDYVICIKPKNDRLPWLNDAILSYMNKNNLEKVNVIVDKIIRDGKISVTVYDDRSITDCKIYVGNWYVSMGIMNTLSKDLFEI